MGYHSCSQLLSFLLLLVLTEGTAKLTYSKCAGVLFASSGELGASAYGKREGKIDIRGSRRSRARRRRRPSSSDEVQMKLRWSAK